MSQRGPGPRRGPTVARLPRGYGQVVLLALVSFLAAVGLHALLGALGLRPEHPARVLLTPLVAGSIIMGGMRAVPVGRRLRMAILAATGLFLYAMIQ
jgi:hypothetical protein